MQGKTIKIKNDNKDDYNRQIHKKNSSTSKNLKQTKTNAWEWIVSTDLP